ncbi:trypsin-like peptidase domain-containing protein [Streptomyces sp. NPDC054932]
MERFRLVGVIGLAHARASGTGFLVGPGLVLTSAHVVERKSARVRVFRPGHEDEEHIGEVVWCGTPKGRDDAALVRVTGPGWSGPDAAPVRWGRFVTGRPKQEAEVRGLPNLVQYDGRPIETYQLTCTINPVSGDINGRHYCVLDQHPPTWNEPGGSPWGGLSGAPVYCGELLVGVVAEDPAYFGRGAVLAVPVAVLDRDPDFRATLAEAGAYAPPEAAELGALADLERRPPSVPSASPAALLRPEANAVPFYGRDVLLAELVSWCGKDGFGARLLHGAGGQGKTRLAGRLAAELAGTEVAYADGKRLPWQVWWPDPEADPDALVVVQDVAAPLLIVLDYAETRPEQVQALLRAAGRHPGKHRLKLLFLARAGGDWWTALRTRSKRSRELLAGADGIALAPLQAGPADRRRAYGRALTAFVAALSSTDGPDWAALAAALPTPPLDQEGHANALTLHMTALVDLLDAATPGRPGTPRADRHHDAEEVEDRLLEHEDGYWRNSAQTWPDLHGHLSPPTLRDALAAALLVGRVDREQADTVLTRLPSFEGQTASRRNSTRTWISELYPPAAGAAWGSLQPDRIAERFVGRRLQEDPDLAHHLVRAAPAQAEHLLDLYTRAAAHPVFGGGLDAPLRDLCLAHRDVLAPHAVGLATRTAAPGPLLAALETVVRDEELPPDSLCRLAESLPNYSERLASWAVEITERVVAHHRNRPPDDPDRLPNLARNLGSLAQRLDDLGERDRGLSAATEAVELWERLEARHPGYWLPALAAGLATLSGQYGDHGRGEESLATVRRSVAIRRRMVRSDRDAHLRELASGVLNLAVRLDDLGLLAESLDASRESTALYAELYGLRPERHRAGYAHALHTYAIALRRTGNPSEAHRPIAEAVRLRRALASELPDAHLRDLGMSLTTLANVQEQLADLEAAAVSAREAVDVARTLLRQRPETHLRHLVIALLGLGNRLHALGRHGEALATGEEAVAAARTSAAERPETDRILLAHTLKNLSADRTTAGQHDRALEAMTEAVGALRAAARTNPQAARAELPDALRRLAACLTVVARTAEALEASAEAVALLTALADEEPGSHLRDLATAHLEHGGRLEVLGEADEWLDSVESAVRLLRGLDGPPPGLEPLLAAFLIDRYAMRRLAQQRLGAALRGVDAAMVIHLSADAPITAMTAGLLHHRAVILMTLRRHDEADQALTKAIRLRRGIVSESPATVVPDLVDVLGLRVWCLAEQNRMAEATSVLAEALEVVRGPLRALPGAPHDSLVLPLYRIGLAAARLGAVARDRERAEQAAALLGARLQEPGPGPELARAIDLLARLGPPAGPHWPPP